jgi:hypothetical protein
MCPEALAGIHVKRTAPGSSVPSTTSGIYAACIWMVIYEPCRSCRSACSRRPWHARERGFEGDRTGTGVLGCRGGQQPAAATGVTAVCSAGPQDQHGASTSTMFSTPSRAVPGVGACWGSLGMLTGADSAVLLPGCCRPIPNRPRLVNVLVPTTGSRPHRRKGSAQAGV